MGTEDFILATILSVAFILGVFFIGVGAGYDLHKYIHNEIKKNKQTN